MTKRKSALEASYDRVAQDYTAEFCGELERKPFDSQVLDQFASSLRDRGPVLEIGCGPGHIARYLHDRGVNMRGIDLSEEMVKCARRYNPDMQFERGNMLHLQLADASLAGVVCFYAIIHLQRREVTRALKEMNRILRPAGLLLLSWHGGKGNLHRSQWYDKPVSIDITLCEQDEMSGYLTSAGFEIEHVFAREPYEFEYPTRRFYSLSRKPLQSE